MQRGRFLCPLVFLLNLCHSEGMTAAEKFDFVRPLSVEDYLDGEKHSEVRHEYFDGEIYAMAGASRAHEIVSMNLSMALHGHLKGGPCQAFKSDMKVNVDVNGQEGFYYPDIVVTCDPNEKHDYYIESPKLIVEILSQNALRDRLEKFLVYQHIPTLEEYVIVSQKAKEPEVTIHRRKKEWKRETHTSGEFTLESIGFTGTVADLYD